VFTTCMEGTWTGVGHREMVWCHQVRWRVARAALELGSAPNNAAKGTVLSRWFRDEVDQEHLAQSDLLTMDKSIVTRIPAGHRLVLRHVSRQSGMYLLPLSSGLASHFILYVSRGTVGSLSPHHAPELQVFVYRCRTSAENCLPLQPRSLKLIPNPSLRTSFPLPEGVDESDGIIRFEAMVDSKGAVASNEEEWIGVAIQGEGDSRSWVVGGIEQEHVEGSDVGKFGEEVVCARFHTSDSITALLWSKISIPVDPAALSVTISMPHVLSNSLVVYRIEAPKILGSCAGAPRFGFFSHSRTYYVLARCTNAAAYSPPDQCRRITLSPN
jgi:GPI inositol-deacylase